MKLQKIPEWNFVILCVIVTLFAGTMALSDFWGIEEILTTIFWMTLALILFFTYNASLEKMNVFWNNWRQRRRSKLNKEIWEICERVCELRKRTMDFKFFFHINVPEDETLILREKTIQVKITPEGEITLTSDSILLKDVRNNLFSRGIRGIIMEQVTRQTEESSVSAESSSTTKNI